MEYQYIASDKQGRRVVAITNADSIPVLVTRLRNQGLIPLQINRVRSTTPHFMKLRSTKGRVRGQEVAIFTRQLATILNAGILLTDALTTISEDMENLYFRAIINKIIEDITAGKTLSQAVSQHAKIFPKAFVAVVRSGEEIGNLGKTLGNLAKYLEELERMKAKIKTALRYPMFLTGFLVLVVSIIVFFLIPKFTAIFEGAGVKLPLLTRIVVGISSFCLRNVIWLIIFGVAVGILCWYLLKKPKIRFWFDTYVLRTPLLGPLLHKALIARFCNTFSILLAGGVGITQSLEVSSDVVDNVYLRQIIDHITNSVISGVPLSEAMKIHQEIPRLVVKMVTVGEKAGSLDEMIKRSGEYYDDELRVVLENFSSLIEPVFIIAIGIVVLIVVIALYLPIFQISMAVR